MKGQARGSSNVTNSRRHICLPHDGTWMAHLPHKLALLPCQGKKHICFPPRHTQGAHHVGTSAYMMGQPGLHPDLGSWDNLIDDGCEGCARQYLGRAMITCARGARRSLGRATG